MISRVLAGILFLVGMWGLVARRNLIKKVFALSIMNSAVMFLFILGGAEIGTQAPILEPGINTVVDPVPQALMLTAVVVGVCVTALALAFSVRLYKATDSLDIDMIRKRTEHGRH